MNPRLFMVFCFLLEKKAVPQWLDFLRFFSIEKNICILSKKEILRDTSYYSNAISSCMFATKKIFEWQYFGEIQKENKWLDDLRRAFDREKITIFEILIISETIENFHSLDRFIIDELVSFFQVWFFRKILFEKIHFLNQENNIFEKNTIEEIKNDLIEIYMKSQIFCRRLERRSKEIGLSEWEKELIIFSGQDLLKNYSIPWIRNTLLRILILNKIQNYLQKNNFLCILPLISENNLTS